jgi:hypothetical protein
MPLLKRITQKKNLFVYKKPTPKSKTQFPSTPKIIVVFRSLIKPIKRFLLLKKESTFKTVRSQY